VAEPNDAHEVIGGARGTGAALVAELLERGHRVRSVWERPFLVDDSKWQRVFGPYQTIPLAEAVERTLTRFTSRQPPR
jgi:NAD(P)-dependent dehydrogenase (short-subunit alcohol dehydrogenase family)